mgnify:CR=1 FL=1
MKNLITLLLFTFFIFSPAFAIEDKKIISDSETQEELMKSFNDVNQYSEGLFTQQNTQQRIIQKE